MAENKRLFSLLSPNNPKKQYRIFNWCKMTPQEVKLIHWTLRNPSDWLFRWSDQKNRRIHDLTVIFSIRSGSINERGVRKRCIITTTVCESAACNLCDVHSSDVTWHSEQSSCCRSSTSDVSSVCGRLCAAGSKRVGHTVVLLITTRVPLHGSCWIILHFVYWYPGGGHCATLTECPCWGCVHSCSTRGGRHTHIHKVQKYQHLYVISTRAEWSISV